jgi:Golgi phosphoprotein 3 (GPP34)
VTLALDILLLNIDGDLRMVREFEYVGYAVRAADLIELAVAERLILTGRWVKWVTIVDATPTGEPLLDASLAALATSAKRLMPTDWMARHPGYSPVDAGLAQLAGQGAVRVNSRRGSGRRTYTEVELLDRARQAEVRARLDRYIAAGSAADVLDWALAGLVYQCGLWIPGHFDRAADRKYKEAAQGERGKSKANPVEATIRMLMSDAHNCRNVDSLA